MLEIQNYGKNTKNGKKLSSPRKRACRFMENICVTFVLLANERRLHLSSGNKEKEAQSDKLTLALAVNKKNGNFHKRKTRTTRSDDDNVGL